MLVPSFFAPLLRPFFSQKRAAGFEQTGKKKNRGFTSCPTYGKIGDSKIWDRMVRAEKRLGVKIYV